MKKILIITYYWPPKGGVGVQRWLKLTKYLCQFGYSPVIYTVKNGISPLLDNSLSKLIPPNVEVIKRNIFEPQNIFSFFTTKKPSSDILIKSDYTWFEKISIWLRSNLFIPDTRCMWIKPSIKFLSNYIKYAKIDVVISTGPPHSTHMIALGLKKNHGIKWIADFRDPWTGIEYFDKMPMIRMVRKKHKRLEKEVLSSANLVLSVSSSWASQFLKLGAKKTYVLTNGYDKDDYSIVSEKSEKNQFKIGHFGIYNDLRNHDFLWETIQKISLENSDFKRHLKLFFSGEVHDNFFNDLKNYQLYDQLEYNKYLNHSTAISHMVKCDILLVVQGKTKSVLGRLPAKVFEYLGAKKPILAIGQKNSDLEKLLKPISYAWFVDFDNTKLLYEVILNIYNSRISDSIFQDDISCFSRENQARELINIIEKI